MKHLLYILPLMFAAAFLSCSSNETTPAEPAKAPAEPDSMLYGLSCDGTNDSVIVFLPFAEGADPVTYNIEVARATGRIIGNPQIGDWVGIILNPADSTEASMVVDLDQLKGTWTYEVRPTWKDASRMTMRAIKRNFAEMPDSMKEAYLIPREYGFTLKRSSKASPVGIVRGKSSLEDDSPVEYPKVKFYTGWKTRNGHLILTSTDSIRMTTSDAPQTPQKEYHDTLDFVFMSADSLVLRDHATNSTISFHRKENARQANAKATEAVAKTTTKELK